MPTATGLVRCILLVVVSLLIDFLDCVPVGYQTLGTIGASTTHTTDILSQIPCSGERLDLIPLVTSQSATGLDSSS